MSSTLKKQHRTIIFQIVDFINLHERRTIVNLVNQTTKWEYVLLNGIFLRTEREKTFSVKISQKFPRSNQYKE